MGPPLFKSLFSRLVMGPLLSESPPPLNSLWALLLPESPCSRLAMSPPTPDLLWAPRLPESPFSLSCYGSLRFLSRPASRVAMGPFASQVAPLSIHYGPPDFLSHHTLNSLYISTIVDFALRIRSYLYQILL